MTPPEHGEPEQSLDARYGRVAARRNRRVAIAVIVSLVVALGGWAVWAALGVSRNTISAIVASYRITSAHRVSVTVEITRPNGDRVRCIVSALATDHSQVGETVVSLPSGRSGTTAVTTSVKTDREATGVDVGSCR